MHVLLSIIQLFLFFSFFLPYINQYPASPPETTNEWKWPLYADMIELCAAIALFYLQNPTLPCYYNNPIIQTQMTATTPIPNMCDVYLQQQMNVIMWMNPCSHQPMYNWKNTQSLIDNDDGNLIAMHTTLKPLQNWLMWNLYLVWYVKTATGNHLKQNLLNQASSDSELTRYRANKLSNSLSNIANDVLFKKSQGDKNDVHSASKQGLFLPMQNMKHNVTEKVAQVRCWKF